MKVELRICKYCFLFEDKTVGSVTAPLFGDLGDVEVRPVLVRCEESGGV